MTRIAILYEDERGSVKDYPLHTLVCACVADRSNQTIADVQPLIRAVPKKGDSKLFEACREEVERMRETTIFALFDADGLHRLLGKSGDTPLLELRTALESQLPKGTPADLPARAQDRDCRRSCRRLPRASTAADQEQDRSRQAARNRSLGLARGPNLHSRESAKHLRGCRDRCSGTRVCDEITSAPGRTRTTDTQVRSLVLYPTELRARAGFVAQPAHGKKPWQHAFFGATTPPRACGRAYASSTCASRTVMLSLPPASLAASTNAEQAPSSRFFLLSTMLKMS
jgi:hypothetical protein